MMRMLEIDGIDLSKHPYTNHVRRSTLHYIRLADINPPDITRLGQNPLPVARPDETPRTLEHNVYDVVFQLQERGSES